MRMPLHTIAVLFHEKNRKRHLRSYAISFLAEFWRQDGHRVHYLFGTRKFIPADLILIHVDLSIVPDEYLDFASRYPIALNRAAKDIRKSRVSTNLLTQGDCYSGKVIVKTDLNCGGSPERMLRTCRSRSWQRLARRFFGDHCAADNCEPCSRYQIYDSVGALPRAIFEHSDVVVEKF